jgi:hypothetical protein
VGVEVRRAERLSEDVKVDRRDVDVDRSIGELEQAVLELKNSDERSIRAMLDATQHTQSQSWVGEHIQVER